jgi:hypothetical protein
VSDKLKPGDRVRIRDNRKNPSPQRTVFEISEVDVTGAGMPAAPSTYLVRMRAVSGGIDLVYGDRALVKAED